jgi:hypothetical protein
MARRLARMLWVLTEDEAAADGSLWWRESMSSTHNESRLAACPLSGIPGRVRAPVN